MPPSVVFAREPLTPALWDEALPLLFAHWKEVAPFPDVELTPAVERYQQLDANGVVRVFTARDPNPHLSYYGTAPLVGYALFTVTPSLHYAHLRYAQQDVLYVQPDRRGTMPVRFLTFCETALFAEGCDVVWHHAKHQHPQLGRVLAHLGYEPIDVLYGKRRITAPSAQHVSRATLAEVVG